MNLRRNLFLALLGIPISLSWSAKADTNTISMQHVIEKAKSGPAVKSMEFSADEARANADASWKGTYLPTLSGGIGYTHLLQDQSINLPPIGGATIPPLTLGRDLTLGSLQLSQTLFDPASMLYNNSASRELADAEHLKSLRQVKETQGKAIAYYLQILELRASRNALDRFVKNLRSRQPEIKRLYELGNVSESDILKVKLGIDDANQGIRDLLQKEAYLGQLLGTELGESVVYSPEDLPDDLPSTAALSNSTNPELREDIQAIDKQLDAIDQSRKGSKAQYLPKVSASIQHYYTNAALLTNQSFDTVGVQLSWSIFDGGVNASKAQAAAAKAKALEEQKGLVTSSILATYENAAKILQLKKQEYEERRDAVVEAKSVTDIEFKRLKTGKTTVNNLIDAEDVLKDRVEKANLSKANWYGAWFSAQLASGAELKAP